MEDIKTQSLSELEAVYKKQLQKWTKKQAEHEKAIDECRQQIHSIHEKLSHIHALLGIPSPVPAGAGSRAAAARGSGKGKRRRKSPVKIATLQALHNRPGQKLTTRKLITAIRHDTGKRVSRQSVNVNVRLLEQEGLIRRQPAPAGAGARFVYSAK